MNKLKSFFDAYKKLFKLNLTGYYCPECSPCRLFIPTAQVNVMKDEKYHKYKYYIQCRDCKLTTPAFEDYEDAFDAWDNIHTLYEDRILLEGAK